jgi:2-keto-4-pentenoate hydratase/2-oxohepta-3-ene-1,7-dioic acid hydratase in catechol pathway
MDLMIPSFWEVELDVVIGKEGKRINRKNAYQHIAGFTILIIV